MKAPDKTFPLSVVGDLLASTPPEEVVFMPDKIYFDGVDTSTTPRLAINEEYIRKDALLEYFHNRVEELNSPLNGVFGSTEREHCNERISELLLLVDKLNEM